MNRLPQDEALCSDASADKSIIGEYTPIGSRRHQGRQRKTFVLVYIGTVLAVAIAVVALNLFCNPAIIPSNERAWKTTRLDKLMQAGTPPRILVLGDSRLFQMDPKQIEAITGKPTFNYAVTSGTIVDSLAQFRYALKIHDKPDLVVIGLEDSPGAWNGSANAFQAGLFAHPGLFAEVPYPENLCVAEKVLPTLLKINVRDTLSSVQGMFRKKQEDQSEMLPFQGQNDAVFQSDGYLIHARWENMQADGSLSVSNNVQNQIKWYASSWDAAAVKLDDRTLGYLKDFLALAKSEGVEVRAVVLPTHPLWEQRCYSSPAHKQFRTDMINRIQKECSDRGFVFFDFTRIEAFQGSPDGFWDGTHSAPVNMRRITNVVFGNGPDAIVPGLVPDIELCRKLSL